MTGYTVKYSTGSPVSGEALLEFEPKFPLETKKNGVGFVHGAGSDATYCIDAYGNQGWLTSAIINAGFSGMSSDNGGPSTWGNATSTTRLGSNVAVLQARPSVKPSSKVALIGASMGGIVALNYARANPDKVSCIVMTIPVINLEDIRANNRSGYAAAINAAYGGTYVESTQGSTRNPYTYRADASIANIPMLIFYGLSDALCLPTYAEQFAAAAPTKRTLVALSSGHEAVSYENTNPATVVAFLNQNNVG